jgi:hypothetical protein
MIESMFLRRCSVALISIAMMILNCAVTAADLSSANTDVVLDQDGNPGCNQIIANASVTEIRVNAPPLNGSDIASDGMVKIQYTTSTPTLDNGKLDLQQ